MNSRLTPQGLVLSTLMIGLATIIVWSWVQIRWDGGAGAATPAPPETAQRVSVVNGVNVVTLDAATRAQSGIRTEPLNAASYQAETAAYGTVLDVQPLIDLRMRYRSARVAADAARAVTTASRQEYERSRVLYQDNQNISLKAFQASQAIYLADQAKADAAALTIENIQAGARQQFGETLMRRALDTHSPEFERLMKRQDVLLRITLPLGGDGSTAPPRIQIEANAGRRLPAYLVSPSPQSDPAVQGNAFIYRVAAPLAVGTHIAVYLPAATQATHGILIPADAIVWYGGQPWAYRQISAERFGRYPVAQQFPMEGGFWVMRGFKPGERVVVSGAQLLLSEELRPPPGSSGCKDPECD